MATKTKDPIREVNLAELKQLEKARRSVTRQLTDEVKRFDKAKQALKIAKRNVKGALARIERRRSILNGRLAA